MKILEILTAKRKKGNLGEAAAAKHLRRNGYRILHRGYVANGHEIDIIAESREVVAIVEVKTRVCDTVGKYEARPAASVTPEKQRAIISAAKYFMAVKPYGKPVRLDVIEVYLERGARELRVKEIKHLPAAFNLNTASVGYRKDRK